MNESDRDPTQELRDHIRALEADRRSTTQLHDTVIQRLFAAGLGLQAQWSATDDPAAADRLGQAIQLIDDAIALLSEAIFGPRDGTFPA